jgi:hypothetical protein
MPVSNSPTRDQGLFCGSVPQTFEELAVMRSLSDEEMEWSASSRDAYVTGSPTRRRIESMMRQRRTNAIRGFHIPGRA